MGLVFNLVVFIKKFFVNLTLYVFRNESGTSVFVGSNSPSIVNVAGPGSVSL